MVDSADLGLLVGAWHAWDMQSPFVPCTVSLPSICPESASFVMEGLSVAEALAALGFADGAAFAEWATTATPAQLNNVGAALAVLIGGS